ncbi:DUF4907 domain-containing protein [Lutibacter holmesii]|uniref:DUF4907 domain-containing protein n=1 Tax=Lutibacter holmesii TaxID=1137985 RepID=A0ABW3WIQ0_9FLAO
MKKVKILKYVLLCLLFLNCTTEKPVYTIKVFEIEQGYGYSIFEKEKLIIRQQYIPAISNLKHFKSEKDAYTVAKLVIEKLKQHKIPSISIDELKNSISL